MKSKFLNLKEFVLVLLLACLETVIGLVAAMPFAASLQLVYFLVPGLTGLINGIIYVLLIKKCPKVGTQFIIPFVYGLLFLFSGSVYVFMFFAILAVANELIMIGGYGKKVRHAAQKQLRVFRLFTQKLLVLLIRQPPNLRILNGSREDGRLAAEFADTLAEQPALGKRIENLFNAVGVHDVVFCATGVDIIQSVYKITGRVNDFLRRNVLNGSDRAKHTLKLGVALWKKLKKE